MADKDKERRSTERLTSRLFVELESSTLNSSNGRGVVVDVSLSGLAIETEADLTPGEMINCHVEIPFQVKARVVGRLIPGQIKRYGLKFVGQSMIDKMLLKKLLKGSRQTKKI